MTKRTYSYEEAHQKTLEYFEGDDIATDVFLEKYALRNDEGEYLEFTPKDMHHRLAREFARAEAKYPNPLSEQEIFDCFDGFRYIIPQGSPMSAIGNPYQVQSLSNCFVIEPPQDAYCSIMKTDQEQAQIMKRRGGVGFDISALRPSGAPTSNAARTSTGITTFMERFSNTTREVAQDGRRGALMLTCACNHIDIEKFISVKNELTECKQCGNGERTKVTGANVSVRVSDEFMHAVENDDKFMLRWPVDSAAPSIEREIQARDLWNKIIEQSWESAEPGVLFWDTVHRNTPSDIYDEFRSESTNPCVTGDTMIATADGRNAVSIKQLADEGRDVPVYCCDDKGRVTIEKMRNPRLTGYDKKILKILLDDGTALRVTENHKLRMINGQYVAASELQQNDQLHVAWKVEAALDDIWSNMNSRQHSYMWLRSANRKRLKSEHRMIYEYFKGKIPEKHVIHHVDYDCMNNSIENLRCMSKFDHDQLHSHNMLGEKNPMCRIKKDPKRFKQYQEKMSKSTSGAKNGRAFDVTNEELYAHAITLTKKLGRRISAGEWNEYAQENGLPRFLVDWRLQEIEGNNLLHWAASEACVEHIDIDPRIVRTLFSMQEQGYDARIEKHGKSNVVMVERSCKLCHIDYWINHDRRESAFCSSACSARYFNYDKKIREKRASGIRRGKKIIAEETKRQQLDVYTQLKFELGRQPMLKEWDQRCKECNVPRRINKHGKFVFKTWNELKHAGDLHNHRVVSIKEDGYENVYNGTVDRFHNFYTVGVKQLSQYDKPMVSLINNQNCGEIALPATDSCRLSVINLATFCRDPFTDRAHFDFDKFSQIVRVAQRLMDDLIDLEIEAIDKIITKISRDDENEQVKHVELELWKKIKQKAIDGRRTGLGITGLGDTIAMMGYRYGSDESINLTTQIYTALAHASHASSIEMAKERGAFPIFDYELEKDHEYLKRAIGDASHEGWCTYGRRNIANTTTSPCGSISLLAGVSSGIEPVPFIAYKRKRKLPADDPRVEEIDANGDGWQLYDCVHAGFKLWQKITGKIDVSDSPYHLSTIDDIDWIKSIEIQAAAQRWVDNSISKTCNFPKDVTKDVVARAYMHAWKSGCKGFTIYREGSRIGVINKHDTDTRESKKFTDNHAPKRPERLPCNIHHATIKGEAWTIIVGMMADRPYELFGGRSSMIELPKKFKSGTLIKHARKTKRSIYDLEVGEGDDSMRVHDVVSVFDNENQGAFTRIISLALRHGTPAQYIHEQLLKDTDSDMQSFSRVISRVLKRYIPDGTVALNEPQCPNCGSERLVYQSGCISCTCGWEKCS